MTKSLHVLFWQVPSHFPSQPLLSWRWFVWLCSWGCTSGRGGLGTSPSDLQGASQSRKAPKHTREDLLDLSLWNSILVWRRISEQGRSNYTLKLTGRHPNQEAVWERSGAVYILRRHMEKGRR